MFISFELFDVRDELVSWSEKSLARGEISRGNIHSSRWMSENEV